MIGLKTKELHLSIVVTVFLLILIGLIVLKSISFHHQGSFLSNPFNKQIIFLIPAITLALIIIFIPRYSIHKYSYPFYVIGIIIVLLPFFGDLHSNTFRWLDLGLPFKIQPSEFAKVFTTIALARYLSDHTIQMKKFSSIIIPIGFVLIPTMIVMKQPDLGTAIVMLTPVLPMLYWSGARPFYLFLLVFKVHHLISLFYSLNNL